METVSGSPVLPLWMSKWARRGRLGLLRTVVRRAARAQGRAVRLAHQHFTLATGSQVH